MLLKCLKQLKVIVLAAVVALSFVFSSLGYRHIETTESTKIMVAAIILAAMYSLMVFELVNRNLAAMIGAAMSVAAYDCLVGLVDMKQIVQWEDLETLALLFGMMVIVGVLSDSGLFDFLAVWSYKRSAGRFWLLVTIMSIITATLSAFVDNVSTMLLMTPTLIRLSELEQIDPRYLLMTMVVFSNLGGCATPVGDPPNLIIIGHPMVASLGITFGSFIGYCAPCVLICMACVLVYLKLVYRSKDSFRLEAQESAATAGDGDAASKAADPSPDEHQLGAELELLVGFQHQLDALGGRMSEPGADLRRQLGELAESRSSAIGELQRRQKLASVVWLQQESHSTDGPAMGELLESHRIKSKAILATSLAVLAGAVLLFFAQSLPGTHLSLGWVSLFAGLILMTMTAEIGAQSGEENFDRVVGRVEWPTLMFFFSLFIVMEAMERLGLIGFVAAQVSSLIGLLPAGTWRQLGAVSVILWSSGLASACIDNVPFTSMMIKVLASLAASPGSGADQPLDVRPLVFALALGACLGGNGTLIGASANLVTAGMAARRGYPISFGAFSRFALPITVLSLLVSNVYLLAVFVGLGW